MLATIRVSPLFEPVARALAYYGVFRHPLTAGEIFTFLPEDGVSEQELQRALDEMVRDGVIGNADGHYFLPADGPHVVERRRDMERRGRRMWRIARVVASILRHAPYVEGVFISGQLCRYLADRHSDIDFFIVASPRRLWIVRTMCVAIRRCLLFNSRKYFCTNYFITSDNVEIRERNLYVANEVASLKPVYNRALFEQFMSQNAWIEEFYPNYDLQRIELRSGAREGKGLRPILERLIPRKWASHMDTWLMDKTRGYWQRKYPNRESRFFDVSLRSRRNESRAHPNDRSTEILTQYRETLRSLGIDND